MGFLVQGFTIGLGAQYQSNRPTGPSVLPLGRTLQIHGVALHIAASSGSGSCIGIKNKDGNGHHNNDSSSNGNHV